MIASTGKYDIAEGKSIYGTSFLFEEVNLILPDLHVALNYGQATGSAQLLRFVTEHTEVSTRLSRLL